MEHEDLNEAELETRVLTLFRSVEAPAPSADFTARTMKAVKRAALVPGRRPLRSPLTAAFAAAALIAGVALSAWAIAINQPFAASAFTTLISGGISVGMRLMQLAGTGLAISDVFTTTGFAILRALMTTEGSTGLMLIAVIGALSLSALHRLLMSEGSERGVSRWQEL